MQKRLLFDSAHLNITIIRLSQQLIENHGDFSESVLIGLQPRGIYLARRIARKVEEFVNNQVPLGMLDITFYRDDFRRRESPLQANATHIDFIIENKKVILIDDVLFTGRSVRAALDAMTAFGRPESVELLVLIDRMYSRDIPIAASYVGRKVNTIKSQRIAVELEEQGMENDKIWLIDKES